MAFVDFSSNFPNLKFLSRSRKHSYNTSFNQSCSASNIRQLFFLSFSVPGFFNHHVTIMLGSPAGMCWCLILRKCVNLRIPGEVEEASRSLQSHKVVPQVEVGEILTIKQIFRHRLQAVAGQVHQTHCQRNHLHTKIQTQWERRKKGNI